MAIPARIEAIGQGGPTEAGNPLVAYDCRRAAAGCGVEVGALTMGCWRLLMTESMEGALRNLRPIVMAALTRGSSNGRTAEADGGVMGLDDGGSRGVLIQAFTFGLRKDQRRAGVIELEREAMLDTSQGAAVGQSRERQGEGC